MVADALDFHADDVAGAVFQHRVNFITAAGSEVEQVRLKLRPAALLEQFQCNEVFQHASSKGALAAQAAAINAQKKTSNSWTKLNHILDEVQDKS